MDWKMLLIGTAMLLAGGFLGWRLRSTSYKSEFGPGCAMVFAILMLITGILTILIGLVFKV